MHCFAFRFNSNKYDSLYYLAFRGMGQDKIPPPHQVRSTESRPGLCGGSALKVEQGSDRPSVLLSLCYCCEWWHQRQNVDPMNPCELRFLCSFSSHCSQKVPSLHYCWAKKWTLRKYRYNLHWILRNQKYMKKKNHILFHVCFIKKMNLKSNSFNYHVFFSFVRQYNSSFSLHDKKMTSFSTATRIHFAHLLSYCVRGTRTQPVIFVGCSVHYWVSCAIYKGFFFKIACLSSSTHICLALRRLLTFCLTLTR